VPASGSNGAVLGGIGPDPATARRDYDCVDVIETDIMARFVNMTLALHAGD
jgi:hypothetical protein